MAFTQPVSLWSLEQSVDIPEHCKTCFRLYFTWLERHGFSPISESIILYEGQRKWNVCWGNVPLSFSISCLKVRFWGIIITNNSGMLWKQDFFYRYSERDWRQKYFVAKEQLLLWQQMHTLDLPSITHVHFAWLPHICKEKHAVTHWKKNVTQFKDFVDNR